MVSTSIAVIGLNDRNGPNRCPAWCSLDSVSSDPSHNLSNCRRCGPTYGQYPEPFMTFPTKTSPVRKPVLKVGRSLVAFATAPLRAMPPGLSAPAASSFEPIRSFQPMHCADEVKGSGRQPGHRAPTRAAERTAREGSPVPDPRQTSAIQDSAPSDAHPGRSQGAPRIRSPDQSQWATGFRRSRRSGLRREIGLRSRGQSWGGREEIATSAEWPVSVQPPDYCAPAGGPQRDRTR